MSLHSRASSVHSFIVAGSSTPPRPPPHRSMTDVFGGPPADGYFGESSYATSPVTKSRPQSSCGSPKPRRHRGHFHASVRFMVEGQIYELDRYFFERDSLKFKEMFKKYENSEADVTDPEADAIVLASTSIVDFDRFLAVLYPIDFDSLPLTTKDEWASVLHFAHTWGFASIQRLAERHVFPLASAVDRIVWGHRYSICAWLLDAYVAVCTRPEPLDESEGERLGVKDVIRISAARQKVLVSAAPPSDVRHAVWRACCPDVPDAACEQLEEELRSLEQQTETEPLHLARRAAERARTVLDARLLALEQAERAANDAEMLQRSLEEDLVRGSSRAASERFPLQEAGHDFDSAAFSPLQTMHDGVREELVRAESASAVASERLRELEGAVSDAHAELQKWTSAISSSAKAKTKIAARKLADLERALGDAQSTWLNVEETRHLAMRKVAEMEGRREA